MGDEQRIHFFEVGNQCMVVGCFDFSDNSEIFGMNILGICGHCALKVPLGDPGIERLAVVKFDPFAQMKRINFSPGRYIPFFRQARYELAHVIYFYQALIDIGIYDTVNCGGRTRCRIKPRGRFCGLTDHQPTARLRRIGQHFLRGSNEHQCQQNK